MTDTTKEEHPRDATFVPASDSSSAEEVVDDKVLASGHEEGHTRSERWTAFVERIRQPVARGTLVLADHAAHNPWSYVIGTVIFTLGIAVTGLFTNFTVETDLDTIFTPVGSIPLAHSKWLDNEAGFPPPSRGNQMFVHADGSNVLSVEGVSRAFDALEAFTGVDGYYEKVCLEEASQDCENLGVTTFWNNSRVIFEDQVQTDQDVIEQVSEPYFPDGRPVTQDVVFGNAIRNETSGLLIFAPIFIINSRTPDNDDTIEWEVDAVEDLWDMQDDWEKESGNVFRLEFYLEG